MEAFRQGMLSATVLLMAGDATSQCFITCMSWIVCYISTSLPFSYIPCSLDHAQVSQLQCSNSLIVVANVNPQTHCCKSLVSLPIAEVLCEGTHV